MTVDGVRTAQGQAPGKLQQLNARSSLYIGMILSSHLASIVIFDILID